jgi:protein-S-isoprenylcysteine O-methyltransferase Ste14
METSRASAAQRRRTYGDMLGNACLGGFLAFAAAFQIIKVNDALADGSHLVALCISNAVMAGFVIVRRPAVSKGEGWSARSVAVIGSFTTLPLGALPLTWAPNWLLAVTSVAMVLSYVWIIWALMTLRRSFSVFAEARKLITHGPYGIVRHPLYAAYFLTYSCSALPKLGPLAIVLLAVGVSAEVMRSRNEERVLRDAFPEYTEYAGRVPAFFPDAFGDLLRGHSKPVTPAPTSGQL